MASEAVQYDFAEDTEDKNINDKGLGLKVQAAFTYSSKTEIGKVQNLNFRYSEKATKSGSSSNF